MKNLTLLFVIIMMFSACEEDPIPKGIESSISGNVSDFPNQIPFQNFKLKVAEYKVHHSGIYTSYEFTKWLDSTYTDNNGDYNFNFKTSGKGNYYTLHVEEAEDLWTYYYDAIEIQNIGGNNFQDLDFLHLYPTKLIITLNDLETSSIMIDVDLFKDPQNIEMESGQIERIIYTNKNTPDLITFRRKTISNTYQNYTLTIPASNSIEINDFNITLNSVDFN